MVSFSILKVLQMKSAYLETADMSSSAATLSVNFKWDHPEWTSLGEKH